MNISKLEDKSNGESDFTRGITKEKRSDLHTEKRSLVNQREMMLLQYALSYIAENFKRYMG